MNKKKLIKKITFNKNTKIKDVLVGFQETAMYTEKRGFGIIVDQKDACVGVVTDGDIRSYLLRKGSIEDKIKLAMNKDFIFAYSDFSDHQILRLFDEDISNIPVLNKKKKIQNIIGYSNLNDQSKNFQNIIRARAPLRMSFSGGGTDYSGYLKDNNTAVLTSSINKYAVVSLFIRTDRKISIYSRDLDLEYKEEFVKRRVMNEETGEIEDKMVKKKERGYSFVGSAEYCAPEILQAKAKAKMNKA